MTPQEVLGAAKQGSPQAIAALMNRHLQPKGITARGNLLNDCLYIVLESAQAPNQQALVTFVSKGIQNLQVASIKRMVIYGRRSGEEEAAWTEQVELMDAHQPAPVSQAFTATEKPRASTTKKIPQFLLWAMSIGGLLALLGVLNVISPTKNDPMASGRTSETAQSPSLETSLTSAAEASLRGEKVFQALQGIYDVGGLLTDNPGVRIILPEDKWNSLSKADKLDLTLYAPSLVVFAKANPQKFAEIPTTAPAYDSFIRKTANLCTDCWQIIVGKPLSNGAISVDRVVVEGDTFWEADDPCCRGVKASEFQKVDSAH